MALTKSFADTVRARAQRDETFRRELLREAVELLLDGKVVLGKALLRDYINSTIGFERLSSAVGTPSKSLHRMFGSQGNPSSANLLRVIEALRKAEHVRFEVSVADSARKAQTVRAS